MGNGITKYRTLEEITNDPVGFIKSRLPNNQETLTTSVSQAITYTALGNSIEELKNPASKMAIRDISKTIPTVLNVWENNTIADTGVQYGEGIIWGNVGKVITKLSIIGGSYATLGKNSLEYSARMANYPGDAVSRFCHISEKEQQIETKTNSSISEISFIDYTRENIQISWLTEAAFETATKVTIVDRLGEATKMKTGKILDSGKIELDVFYTHYIKEAACNLDNALATTMGGTNTFTPYDDIYGKFVKSYAMFSTDAAAVALPNTQKYSLWGIKGIAFARGSIVFTGTAAIDLIAKISNEVVNAYFLGTSARCIQDITGAALKSISHTIEGIERDLAESIVYHDHFTPFIEEAIGQTPDYQHIEL
jgi:hypothetical protein